MENEPLMFLKQLLTAPSPSGFEQPAQRVWREYVSHFAEVNVDLHGNNIASYNSTGSPKIMLAAHCDEIGFIIKHIDENGYIYVDSIGGHDFSIIAGRIVEIAGAIGKVSGVTCKKSSFMMKDEEKRAIPEIKDIWIDIGVKTKQEALEVVSIGDPIVYINEYKEIGDHIAISRGFDDKIGVFIVAETLRFLQNEKIEASLFCVSTVQEEIGLRGARTSTCTIDPLIGIAIDVTDATDIPGSQPQKQGEINIGAGPAILRGANANQKVTHLLLETAKENKIPYQIEADGRATPTDANVIQLSREGVATGLVSIPLRYMHTPTELLSLEDVENTIKLLVEFVKRIKNDTDFRP